MSTRFDHNQRRVNIIGGSIAGLTAGLALLRRGWDVNIYEATRGDMKNRGAGIITHPSLHQALQNLGVASKDSIGVLVKTRKAFDKTGTVIRTTEFEQIASSWGRLYQLLKEQFPHDRYHDNKIFSHAEQCDTHITARFKDGTRLDSDLLVAADGIRSTIRQQLEPGSRPLYAGYVAWRGLIEEQDLSETEKRDLLPFFTFCLPEGEQVLTYPIAGLQNQLGQGNRRCNVVWYRPAAKESTLQELLTDVDGNNNGESIAPDKVRPELIRQMQSDARKQLSPQHAALFERLAQPFIQPIYDLAASRMIYGRIVLVGDAAYTARPHLGVGITKAAEDSLCLAQALDTNQPLSAALNNFEAQRSEINHDWVKRSRELGAYLQAQLLSEDERRHAKMHRTTEAVMRETAGLLT